MESTNGIWSLEDAQKYHVHSPALAKWMIVNMPKSLIHDFGCGDGYYVKQLFEADHSVMGYEGTPGIKEIAHPNVEERDIRIQFESFPGNVICIEVMEHIHQDDELSVLVNIDRNCRKENAMLILSWAIPGQAGHGHINCRDLDYVVNRMAEFGFKCNWEATTRLRMIAPGGDPFLQFFQNTLYVFNR